MFALSGWNVGMSFAAALILVVGALIIGVIAEYIGRVQIRYEWIFAAVGAVLGGLARQRGARDAEHLGAGLRRYVPSAGCYRWCDPRRGGGHRSSLLHGWQLPAATADLGVRWLAAAAVMHGRRLARARRRVDRASGRRYALPNQSLRH
jgi:hypothetical protein